MINKTSKFKKILSLCIAMLFLSVQSYGLLLSFNSFKTKNIINTAFADVVTDSYGVEASPVITNGDFTSSSYGDYPKSPSSWNVIERNEAVLAGVIDTSSDAYDAEAYNTNTNPGKYSASLEDDKVLMINAKDGSFAGYGYSSSDITLKANGYYQIDIYYYTSSAAAGFYVEGLDEDNVDTFSLGNVSEGHWSTYSFYIETSIENKTVSLELYNGGKSSNASGVVFFDDITVSSYSNEAYASVKPAMAGSDYSIVDLTDGVVIENAVNNAGFENGLTDWTLQTTHSEIAYETYNTTGVYNVTTDADAISVGLEESPSYANIANNTKALLIKNSQEASIGYSSSDILIERNTIYKLSVFVKTNKTANATLILNQQNPYGEDNDTYTPVSSTYSGINTYSLSNDVYDNWIQYSFAVYGSSLFDSTVNIELWLGTEDTPETGYAWFDNVSLEKITTAQAEGLQKSNTSKMLDINETTGFKNGAFNDYEIKDITDTLHKASNWTITSNNANIEDDTNAYSGIISNTHNFAAESFSSPFTDSYANNVLMLANEGTVTSQGAISNTYALNASTAYKVSVNVMLEHPSNLATADIYLKSGGNYIGMFEGISSSNVWTTYNFYILNSNSSLDVSLELWLGGSNDTDGYAFFDNVRVVTYQDTDFDNDTEVANESMPTNSTTTFVADLSKNDFDVISQDEIDGVYTPLTWTGTNNSNTNEELLTTGVVQDVNTVEGASDNVLKIASLEDTNYTYTSNLSTSIEEDKYYKVSVWVKTANLSQQTENVKYEDEDETNPIAYGAFVNIENIDESFNAINTNGEYEEFIFYINATDAMNLKFNLSLGNSNALTTGSVYFDNLTVEDITETTYTTATQNLTGGETNIINIENTTIEVDNETDTDTTPTLGSNFDWLLIPTLILGIALVIAIVGFSIRRIEFSKFISFKKKPKISYDRVKTLNRELIRRELIKERDAKIATLRKELEDITAKLKEEEEKQKILAKKLEDFDKKHTKESLTTLSKEEANKLKAERKDLVREENLKEYKAKTAKLTSMYAALEKEIEKLDREEKILYEEYKIYKKELKRRKAEYKQEQKLKLKLAREKEKAEKLAIEKEIEEKERNEK